MMSLWWTYGPETPSRRRNVVIVAAAAPRTRLLANSKLLPPALTVMPMVTLLFASVPAAIEQFVIAQPDPVTVIGAATFTDPVVGSRFRLQLCSRKLAISNSTVEPVVDQVNVGRLVPRPMPIIVTSVVVPRLDQESAAPMVSV